MVDTTLSEKRTEPIIFQDNVRPDCEEGYQATLFLSM